MIKIYVFAYMVFFIINYNKQSRVIFVNHGHKIRLVCISSVIHTLMTWLVVSGLMEVFS